MRLLGLRRIDLSRIVNELLQKERPIPLEFVADGVFIRGSIDEYLTSLGISSETTLRLEYRPASLPPTYSASYEHDDWISSVDVLSGSSPPGQNHVHSGHERIVSGCNNGSFQIWNMSSEVLATSPLTIDDPHIINGIRAVKFISPTRVISSTIQGQVTIWDYNDDGASLKPYVHLRGHQKSVASLETNTSSQRILSSSNDHTIRLWSIKKSENPEAPSSSQSQAPLNMAKRTKKSSTGPSCGALSMLKGHSAAVTSSMFAPTDHTVAYSASEDHKVITWDLTSSKAVDTRTTSSALFGLTALPALNLLAVGASPYHITLIDPRVTATSVAAMTLKGHTNRVVSLANDPTSDHGLLSGSHDSTCKIWDLRSIRRESDGTTASNSIFTIPRKSQVGKPKPEQGGESSVFAVAWDRDVGIVSGGKDGNVDVHRPHQPAAANGA